MTDTTTPDAATPDATPTTPNARDPLVGLQPARVAAGSIGAPVRSVAAPVLPTVAELDAATSLRWVRRDRHGSRRGDGAADEWTGNRGALAQSWVRLRVGYLDDDVGEPTIPFFFVEITRDGETWCDVVESAPTWRAAIDAAQAWFVIWAIAFEVSP